MIYLTIIPQGRMGYDSIGHDDEKYSKYMSKYNWFI